ncbi:MAG: SIMPL domain-containing protein [Pirellulales bacterium]
MQRAIRLPTLFIVLALTALARADENDKLVPSITVVGQGEVQVRPDMANVAVGVTTEAETASEALTENNRRMAQLLKTLRGLDIPDKHVQTSSFNVSPKQSYDRDRREPPKIVGYTVTNQVNVKVMEVSRLGSILDAVVETGGNRIQGVGFSLAEPQPHMDQARRKAMADARHRAELYAAEAGVKLGAPLLISEQSASLPRPLMTLGVEVRGVAAPGEVPISQGEQTITAHVTVTYAIVP